MFKTAALGAPVAFQGYTELVKSTVKIAGARKVSSGVVLKNSVRITEDEADAIVSRRALRGKKRFPPEEVLRARGCKLER